MKAPFKLLNPNNLNGVFVIKPTNKKYYYNSREVVFSKEIA